MIRPAQSKHLAENELEWKSRNEMMDGSRALGENAIIFINFGQKQSSKIVNGF